MATERDIRSVSLETLGLLTEGRASSQFDAAFNDCIHHVLGDMVRRSDGVAKSEITIKVTIEGTEDGRASLSVATSYKLPPMLEAGASLINLGGSRYGVDLTDPQQKLFEPTIVTK